MNALLPQPAASRAWASSEKTSRLMILPAVNVQTWIRRASISVSLPLIRPLSRT
jgi:hypothetical protein